MVWNVALALYCLAQLSPGGPTHAGLPQSPLAGAWLNIHDYEYVHMVMPEEASPAKMRAGAVFAALWEQSTAREITISPLNEGRINVWLGRDAAHAGLIDDTGIEPLGAEGYHLLAYAPSDRERSRGAARQIVVAAQTDEGALNGVYALFRTVVNARWLAPDLIIVPRALQTIRGFEIASSPLFTTREVACRMRWPEAREWQEAHGFHAPFVPGGFGANSMATLLPPEDYPGCYHDGALCWSAPEMVEAILAEAMRLYAAKGDAALEERRAAVFAHPSGTVISLAPAPDAPWCACPLCAEAAGGGGSPAAAQWRTVHAVAQEWSALNVDVEWRLHTLIPGPLPPPPANGRAHPDVWFQVTTAGCDFSRAFDDTASPANAVFLDHLEAWSKVAHDLYVWDYGFSMAHPLAPFPNIPHIRRNLQVLAQHNVRGVYVDGGRDPAIGPAELAGLRAYLFARYLWDPDQPAEEVMGFFLERYYGPAAPHLQEYLRINAAHAHNYPHLVTAESLPAWAGQAWIEEARACIEQALALEGLQEAVRQRVERAALPVKLMQYLHEPTPETLESLLAAARNLEPDSDPDTLRTAVIGLQSRWQGL